MINTFDQSYTVSCTLHTFQSHTEYLQKLTLGNLGGSVDFDFGSGLDLKLSPMSGPCSACSLLNIFSLPLPLFLPIACAPALSLKKKIDTILRCKESLNKLKRTEIGVPG